MEFVDRHKALIITILITGIIVFGMFSFHIKQQEDLIAETYFEIEPQTIEELKELQELQEMKEALASNTNEAFNEDKEFKEMMRNFKSMANSRDERAEKTEAPAEDASQAQEDVLTSNSNYNSSKNYAIKEQEKAALNRAKDILAMHSPEKKDKNQTSNKRSSVTFSLKGRSKVKLPPPVYLCEDSGKIVINVTVNSDGLVTKAYLNSSSSSDNQCLIDSALEYAKAAIFNADASQASQIGSITYYFQAK